MTPTGPALRGPLLFRRARGPGRGDERQPGARKTRRRTLTVRGAQSVGGAIIARDITDRQRAAHRLAESERRLAAIIEQSTVGVVQTDLEGRIELVNACYARIVGRSAEELQGMRVDALTHPDDAADGMRQFRELVAGGPAFSTEMRYVRPDGEPRWVSAHVSLVHDDAGRPLQAVAVVLDITARMRAARQRG